MEDVVRQRLRQFVKSIGITVVAAEIGYKQSTFSSKLTGDRGLDVELIVAILTRYPELSAEWLLRGSGQMYLDKLFHDPELNAIWMEKDREIFRLKQRIAELEGEKKELAL